jgi:teichuronic acid biosynthesis glycosyltransferase TuaC
MKIRVLTVCSGTNDSNRSFADNHPFVSEQMQELKKLDVEFEIFLIHGRGILGYLKSRKKLQQKIASNTFDLIHAHFGFAGLLAVLQSKIPVVISFIGCDINVFVKRLVSWVAMLRSSYNIFVSNDLQKKAKVYRNSIVLPYGIDFSTMYPIERSIARKVLMLDADKKICLFGSSKTRKEKNYTLAKQAVELCENIELINLNGQYTKEEVNLLVNAVDCLILTSLREGSPQIIKEAMACNVPIVSTNVGDVKNVIGKTDGCYISSYDPKDVANNINKALKFGQKTDGRDIVGHLDNKIIAEKLLSIYKQIKMKN